MANRHMKRYLKSLVMKDMQIKITTRYYYILTRMYKMEKTMASVGKDVEKLELSHTTDT